jgi:hypothetical protein
MTYAFTYASPGSSVEHPDIGAALARIIRRLISELRRRERAWQDARHTPGRGPRFARETYGDRTGLDARLARALAFRTVALQAPIV